MATGDRLVAEVLAERIDLRVRLYRTAAGYRIRVAGLGWAPGVWRAEAEGMRRLLACEGYGRDELAELRRMCRPTY